MGQNNNSDSVVEIRPVSLKKIEANRRNAQLSTGPKTVQGKGRSRWNAFKHGILAYDLLILATDDHEEVKEFEELAGALWMDREPVGKLEEILVERIAVCIWRQKRALRCEAGLTQLDRYSHMEDVARFKHDYGCEKLSHWPTDRFSLPDAEGIDRILRYETAIQRQMDRALDQLERLQRRRKGEHVPAPVEVHLTSDQ